MLFALIALPFVLLVIVVVAPFIWFDDRGPIFYAGKRIGYKGKPFGMLKFRSMKVNAPDIRLEVCCHWFVLKNKFLHKPCHHNPLLCNYRHHPRKNREKGLVVYGLLFSG